MPNLASARLTGSIALVRYLLKITEMEITLAGNII